MTNFQAFTIITILLFTSCQTSADKDHTRISQTPDSTQKPVDRKAANIIDSSFAIFVATLKDGIDEADATINDSIIFKATKGQLIIYENYSQIAWIADGRSAYISPDQIVKVDTPYFKFNFSKWDFIKTQDYELLIAAKRKNIDLNSLIQKIRRKNKSALKEFLHLQDVIDGAAAEEYYYDFWALVSVWTDKELKDFITSLNIQDGLEFGDILINRAPLGNGAEYYHMYYPKTSEIIRTL
jgi:hypothetical protein